MLPNLVTKEDVTKLLADRSVIDVLGTLPYIDTRSDDTIDIGCFSIDKLDKYRITYVPVMLIDDSRIIDDVTNNFGILGFRAPSAAVESVRHLSDGIVRVLLNSWYRQELSGIMAKYPGKTKVFYGLLYFEVADEMLKYKCKMLNIKTNFCLYFNAKVRKRQNIDFWYDAVYDVSITKDNLPERFIYNNPDFVYVIEH